MMVDLPAPEGPEITMGWLAARASLEMGTESIGDMVEVLWVKVRKEGVLWTFLGWRLDREG